MKKRVLSIILLMIISLFLSACSGKILSSNVDSTKMSSSGYYRGHYGQSGWNNTFDEKSHSIAYPIFISETR